MNSASVDIHFVKATLKHINRKKIDVDLLLLKSRIPPSLLDKKGARISAKQYADLQAAAMLVMDDEMLGYTDMPLRAGTWTIACHWAAHSKTLGQALRKFCRFYRLLERGFSPKLIVRDNLAIIQAKPFSGKAYEPFAYELFFFSLHRFACWLCAEKLEIESVRLPFERPKHVLEYRPIFSGHPVFFKQAGATLSIHRSVLNKSIRQNSTTLNEFLADPLYELLIQDYDQTSWSALVKKTIGKDLANILTLEQVAFKLNVHSQTLRRHLSSEGQSYKEIKRQIKRDLAINYLSNNAFSVDEIAHKVGFSEASAFIRAFKSWTGVTPHTYRKDL